MATGADRLRGRGAARRVEGEARAARLELLERLAGEGVPLESCARRSSAGRLTLLPVERALAGDGPRYTPREIAEIAGVDLDLLQRSTPASASPIRTPTSGPDRGRPGGGAADKAFLDAGLPEEGMLQVARTIGMGTARIAEANRELVGADPDAAGRHRARPGAALRRRRRAHAAVCRADPRLRAAGAHAGADPPRRDRRRRPRLGRDRRHRRASRSASPTWSSSPGSARRSRPRSSGSVAGRLEEMATAVAEPPVRLVKMIGDAAMLVSTDAEAMLEAALRLVEAAEEKGEEFPCLRAGIAYGPALAQSGDYYGRPVNLASRITGIARPGSVARRRGDARRPPPDAFDYSFAGERRLKGFDSRVRLYRARRCGRRLGRLAAGDEQVVEELRREAGLEQAGVDALQGEVAAEGEAGASARRPSRARRSTRPCAGPSPRRWRAAPRRRRGAPRSRPRAAGGAGRRGRRRGRRPRPPARGRRTARPPARRGGRAPTSRRQAGAASSPGPLRQRRQPVAVARGLAAKAIVPPGRSTRRNSAKARSRSGMWCRTAWPKTRSKLSSSNGSCSASVATVSTSSPSPSAVVREPASASPARCRSRSAARSPRAAAG